MDKKRYPLHISVPVDAKIVLGVKSESIRSQLFRQDIQFDHTIINRLDFLFASIKGLWNYNILTTADYERSLYRLTKQVKQHVKQYNSKCTHITIEEAVLCP